MFDRARWTTMAAAVAVTVVAGVGLPSANAIVSSGDRDVFVPITPCRLLDTRAASQVGSRGHPLLPGETYTQAVTGTNGNCTIPADANAVAMNVTVVNGTIGSFLTVWPADAAQPLASSLNWVAGAPATPNKVDVKLSVAGTVSLFNNSGTVDVVADIVGFYADHNHDDRYYTKPEVDGAVAAVATVANAAARSARVDTYDEYSMRFLTVAAGITMSVVPVGVCLGNTGTTSVNGFVALVVPVGARLTSVDVAMFDGATSSYSGFLIRDVLSGGSLNSVAIGPIINGGGQTNIVVHHVITPPVPEIVATGVSYHLELDNFANGANGFCQATVAYNTDG
ncbi:MAG: hypothetical protein JWL72_4487 [Ilumatobacteraceae bacterium]|nr:hypothetical protein [Ilumatobacteraceae bacterium]